MYAQRHPMCAFYRIAAVLFRDIMANDLLLHDSPQCFPLHSPSTLHYTFSLSVIPSPQLMLIFQATFGIPDIWFATGDTAFMSFVLVSTSSRACLATLTTVLVYPIHADVYPCGRRDSRRYRGNCLCTADNLDECGV